METWRARREGSSAVLAPRRVHVFTPSSGHPSAYIRVLPVVYSSQDLVGHLVTAVVGGRAVSVCQLLRVWLDSDGCASLACHTSLPLYNFVN
jgi:hypothetical protein